MTDCGENFEEFRASAIKRFPQPSFEPTSQQRATFLLRFPRFPEGPELHLGDSGTTGKREPISHNRADSTTLAESASLRLDRDAAGV